MTQDGGRGAGTLVYDGDCGFCTTSAGVARRIGRGVTTEAWQLADLERLGVSSAEAAGAVQFVSAGGAVSSGAEAVARFLVAAGGAWAAVGRLLLLPGVRHVAAGVYRVVARFRYRLPGGTPACRLPPS
jgi:predicted DCC family thiol-disulfide oxidoreductase YuxK